MMDYFILCGLNCHGNTAQVYMATTKYASEYLMQYQGHTTPVNNVKFNPFVPVGRTFLRPFIRWGWERRFRRHLLQPLGRGQFGHPALLDLVRRLVIRKSVQHIYQLLKDKMLRWKSKDRDGQEKKLPWYYFVCQEIFMTCAAEFSVMLWHKFVAFK